MKQDSSFFVIWGVTLIGLGVYTFRNYFCDLKKRINATDVIVWDVQINGVTVGTVTDAKYAQIWRDVFSVPSTYAMQFLNILKIALNAFSMLIYVIPLIVFWGIIGLSIFSPSDFNSLVSEIQKLRPLFISQVISSFVPLFALYLALLFGTFCFIGFDRLGCKNHFSEKTSEILRKHCRVPTQGEMTLTRWVDNEAHINSEMSRATKANENRQQELTAKRALTKK